jgi:hypothetical protein
MEEKTTVKLKKVELNILLLVKKLLSLQINLDLLLVVVEKN